LRLPLIYELSNPGLIYHRYRHLFPTEVREAVSMLDRMVAGTPTNAETGGSTSGQ